MATQVQVPSLAALGAATAAAIGRHFDWTFRAMVRHGHRTETPQFLRLVTGELHPFGNFALVSSPADLDATREAVAPLISERVPSAVFFPDMDVPASVDACLTEKGFTLHGSIPAMAIDIAGLRPTALADGYELVRVGAGDDGEEWERQFAVGYELPLGVAQCFSPVALGADTSPESAVQFFAIRRNGTIVCTSTCCLDGGLAGIYCVSTIPEERGKGLGAHATAEPLRLATRGGYRVGVLQSSEAGHNLYRSLGFADFGGIPLYVRIPA
jgi:ribosomal protein S18 acetylase RimI-like enzyme